MAGNTRPRVDIVNVPSDFPVTVTSIPRQLQDKEILAVELKRRLTDPHAYLTKYIRPQVVMQAAALLLPKLLYQEHGVTLNTEWDVNDLDPRLQFLSGMQSEDVTEHTASPDESEPVSEFEGLGEEDPAVTFDTIACDFNAEPEVIYPVAPGEGQRPLSIFKDPQVGPLGFPAVWGGRGRVLKRKVPITQGQILKAETRNRHPRFRRNGPHLCFNAVLSGIAQVSRATMFALRKRKGDKSTMTADDILNKDGLQTLQTTNRGFSFHKNIRFSPAYYSEKQRELLAWVRQFGKPSWFVTVSMPEHEWTDLLKILFRTAYPGQPVPSDEELLALPKALKDELIKGDPASVVQQFNFKINHLLKKIIRQQHGPLGNVIDYFRCHRGTVSWIVAPSLLGMGRESSRSGQTHRQRSCDFIDSVVSCSATLPDIEGLESMITESDRQLPNMRQLHAHRATCKKEIPRRADLACLIT